MIQPISNMSLAEFNVDGRAVSLRLSSSGEAPATGSRITLKLFGVGNDTVAASLSVGVGDCFSGKRVNCAADLVR